MSLSSKIQDIAIERCTHARYRISVVGQEFVGYGVLVYVAGDIEFPDWLTSLVVQRHEQATPSWVVNHVASHNWSGTHAPRVFNVAFFRQRYSIGGIQGRVKRCPAVVVNVSSPPTPRTLMILHRGIPRVGGRVR